MVTALRISTDLLQRILAHAAEVPEIEACGLLIGAGADAVRIVPARNVAPDPARAFEIDPAMLFAAHREVRGSGLDIIGCYHSHPNGDVRPSARDAAAAEPGRYWLIAARHAIGAYQATASGFVEISFVHGDAIGGN